MKPQLRSIVLLLTIGLLAACSSKPAGDAENPPDPAGQAGGAPLVESLSGAEGSSISLPPGLERGLDGRLFLIQYDSKGNRLIEVQLESGQVRTLFQAPGYSWLGSAEVSPDGTQLLLTYAAPPPEGEPPLGYTGLYLLPSAGGQPEPFLLADVTGESYTYPTWSPDGLSVYYTHVYPLDPDSQTPAFQSDIERATLDGETMTVVAHALWPAVSPDGSRLSYLTADPANQDNELYTAGPDGSNPAPVLEPGEYLPVDAHMFTRDGGRLIFSMVNEQPAASRSLLEVLLGVETALAHSVPSDWYHAPVDGGEPQRITELNQVGLAGDISPDGEHIAFVSSSGLYVMALDGSDLVQVSSDVLVGAVDWTP